MIFFRKILAYSLPVIIIMLFWVIMLSPLLFKGEQVTQQLELLYMDINNEDWETAEKNHALLQEAWHKTILRIQFGENRDDINELNRNLVRLKGLIMAKDKANALSELIEADYRWQLIGK